MARLPLFIDADEAIEFYQRENLGQLPNSVLTAWVIKALAEEGYDNPGIRAALGIHKNYVITHFLRVAKALSDEEFDLWNNNQGRITFGHLRAIAKLPKSRREPLIRQLLIQRIPVHEFELIARGKEQGVDVDTNRLATEISEQTGRPTTIRFNRRKQKGSITVEFFGLDDFDDLCMKLGYHQADDY